MIAENGNPVIAKLHRCIDGRPGRKLLDGQRLLREQLTSARRAQPAAADVVEAALIEAGRRDLARG